VMLGASYTLKRNEHVRVDIFYMTLSRRGQLWIDILGTIVFLVPTCAILAWLAWPFFMQSYVIGEHSSNAGGLLRWPIKLVLPIGFALLIWGGRLGRMAAVVCALVMACVDYVAALSLSRDVAEGAVFYGLMAFPWAAMLTSAFRLLRRPATSSG